MARLDGQRFAELTLSVLEMVRQNRFANESLTDTFMRLIGLTPNIDIGSITAQSGDLSTRTQQKVLTATTGDGSQNKRVTTGQVGKTIVDGFFKSQDDNQIRMRQLVAAYIENLISFVKRWGRLQRGQQYRRIQRLIGNTSLDSFDTSLIGAAPIEQVSLHTAQKGADDIRIETVDVAEVVRKINEGLKDIELSKQNKSAGELTLQLSLYSLILEQLSWLLSSIPQGSLGELGGVLTSIIKAPVAGIEATGRKLEANRRSLGVELAKLREQSALIIDGIVLETGEKTSLLAILQGLFFLTSKLEYKCKNCRFFGQGERISALLPPEIARENAKSGAICTYSFEQGVGRPSAPDNSCKEVWGLSSNDYWVANETVIESFTAEFKIKEEPK